MGLPRVTGAQLEDAIGHLPHAVVRWAVVGHDGPGRDVPLPEPGQLLRRVHPGADDGDRPAHARARRSARRRGRAAHLPHRRDPRPLGRHGPRAAAEAAGRDPHSVRVWAVLATVEESVPEEVALRKTVGRLATYLQGYGQVLVRRQRLGPRGPRALPARPARRRLPGSLRRDRHRRAADATCATTVIPPHWLAGRPPPARLHAVRRASRTSSTAGRGQRDPARRHPDELRPGGRGVEPGARRRPVRRPARQPGVDAMSLPAEPVSTPDLLTSAWVSAALGRMVEVRSVEPVGTGQIGACYRVGLSDGDGVTASLLAKLPAPDPATREMLAGAYRGEVTFYADLAATVAVRGAALRLRGDPARLGGVHAAAARTSRRPCRATRSPAARSRRPGPRWSTSPGCTAHAGATPP